jgi:hypothetical protein
MKMTRITKLGMAALGAALLAWLGLMLFSDSPTKLAADVTDDTRCPVCGRELPAAVQQAGGDCPFCKADGKSVDVRRARASASGSAWRGPAIPTLLVAALVLLLVVHGVFLVRHRARAAKEDVVYIVSCKKCGRRLRYRERQGGQIAKCPLCQTIILFPKFQDERRRRWPASLLGKILKR